MLLNIVATFNKKVKAEVFHLIKYFTRTNDASIKKKLQNI